MIQPAMACPAPAAAIPAENPQQWKKLSRSSVKPISGSASGENGIGPFTQLLIPASPNEGILAAHASASGAKRS